MLWPLRNIEKGKTFFTLSMVLNGIVTSKCGIRIPWLQGGRRIVCPSYRTRRCSKYLGRPTPRLCQKWMRIRIRKWNMRPSFRKEEGFLFAREEDSFLFSKIGIEKEKSILEERKLLQDYRPVQPEIMKPLARTSEKNKGKEKMKGIKRKELEKALEEASSEVPRGAYPASRVGSERAQPQRPRDEPVSCTKVAVKPATVLVLPVTCVDFGAMCVRNSSIWLFPTQHIHHHISIFHSSLPSS